ncbi:MAG: thiamine pyrophosphate-dependent enzyme [Sandaracinaceae bacterium]|nr:thiamine pyrophosphate-dependent enzyme [Sandaracinaceae bacterium]
MVRGGGSEGVTGTREAVSLASPEGGAEACILGNEAIVRGAIEAGVAFVSGYPGTPSSEVTDTFARLAAELGVAFEHAVNEKVALETAFAAALAGARSLTAMKHLGLVSAGDPLSTIPYVGVEAGMVIVSAGDPGCRTSPNEQDQRHLGPMLHLPVLDPSGPAEAHAMTRLAFEVSEASRLPVLLRPTARVCHSQAPVRFGPARPPEVRGYRPDPPRHVPLPVNARRMRTEIDERMRVAARMLRRPELFVRERSGPTVILATGAPAATTADVLRARGDDLPLYRLGVAYPLPEDDLAEALAGVERMLVVEELSPHLEDALAALCHRRALSVEILGKRTGHLPFAYEYTPPVVARALDRLHGRAEEPEPPPPDAAIDVPPRPPSLCPGCPHRAAFFAARAAFDADQLFFNDIGCYTLGYGEPLDCAHAVLCMGAGFTLAAGVARVTGARTVGFMGDSTFFHSGMPALLDAIRDDVSMVAVVLDNEVTAMTGFQPSPSSGPRSVSVEGVARALGAAQVETIDPYDLPTAIAAFRRARDATGTSVVVVRRACPVHAARRGHRDGGMS